MLLRRYKTLRSPGEVAVTYDRQGIHKYSRPIITRDFTIVIVRQTRVTHGRQVVE